MLTYVTYHLISIHRRNEHLKSSNNHLKICNIWTNCKLFFVTNIGFQQCNAPGFKSWTGKKITTKKWTLVQIHVRQLFLNMNEKKMAKKSWTDSMNFILHVYDNILFWCSQGMFFRKKKKPLFAIVPAIIQ